MDQLIEENSSQNTPHKRAHLLEIIEQQKAIMRAEEAGLLKVEVHVAQVVAANEDLAEEDSSLVQVADRAGPTEPTVTTIKMLQAETIETIITPIHSTCPQVHQTLMTMWAIDCVPERNQFL